jgi:putative ubiquitin-RnfH superfamily antitoxin RatB of RatAB toxin-antitoxin module
MESKPSFEVTVVYSPAPREICEVVLQLPQGSNILQALTESGFLQRFPSIDHLSTVVGVWGRKVGVKHILRDRDRVEVYRPLTVDPKVARRERFAKQGARTAGLFVKKRVGAKAGY